MCQTICAMLDNWILHRAASCCSSSHFQGHWTLIFVCNDIDSVAIWRSNNHLSFILIYVFGYSILGFWNLQPCHVAGIAMIVSLMLAVLNIFTRHALYIALVWQLLLLIGLYSGAYDNYTTWLFAMLYSNCFHALAVGIILCYFGVHLSLDILYTL